MQTIIDNILINYELFGAENKRTILILHGWKNSLKNWENIAISLAKENKVVIIDLPGFGNSSLPIKRPFDTYDYAELVNKLVEKLDLKNVILAGHSFGGKISVIVASNNTNIRKLVLIDISGINEKSSMLSVKKYLFKLGKIFLPKNIAEKLSKSLSSDDYKSAGNLRESFKKIITQDISQEASLIKIPTLIIWGEKDSEVPLSSARILKNLIKNSTLRIVWNTNHHPHLEKPEKFLEILKEFI